MLTERRKQLLQYIVEEYVQTAQPVGSQAIVKKYQLPFSSATIRNEMGALEDAGFIAQPHTSAGRVPTDAGYRFYVETLMHEDRLSDELQQTIRHQFHQAARELEEWARLAAAILSARLQNAAVVTTPHSPEPRVRWVELVGVHDYLALLVVVLQEARVLQQTLQLERPFTQDELTKLARQLNDAIAGKTAAEIREQKLELTAAETTVRKATADLLQSADELAPEPSFMEGVRDLLRQPEFTQGERIVQLLEVFEERNLARAIPASVEGGNVTIVIGGEHPIDEMRLCSVVTTRYGGPDGLRGMLSVVGPTRMDYGRNVAMVRYMSRLMEELLGVYFA
ncbi:MAG TPA: heat-inducible transcriptional repressor HrcA [Dehalococcoidia bacterium]|nr:heat-inducible transcriptional repressor HrcA [Dehalococcoidia bacterium]